MSPKSSNTGLILMVMLVCAVALSMLAEFQWMELLRAQQGGTSFCAISETLNCDALWNSSFAKDIHKRSSLPIAGWGLVYGLMALAAILRGFGDLFRDRSTHSATWMARMIGVVGSATSVVLLGVSWKLGSFCITCIGTYTLVLLYTGLSFKLPKPEPFGAVGAGSILGPTAGALIVSYLVLLYPGSKTPIEPETHIPKVAKKPVEKAGLTEKPGPTEKPSPTEKSGEIAPNDPLAAWITGLPSPVRQALSDAIGAHKEAHLPPGTAPASRLRHGAADAPVKLVDFSDIRCGHCRRLHEIMHLLKEQFGGQAYSQESRWFPLDARCNPMLDPRFKSGDGERCVGAKVAICLEQDPSYERVKGALFAAQETLTVQAVYDIAVRESRKSKETLQACVNSAETKSKLEADIAYAWRYKPEGTPLLLINGRPGQPQPPLLYALILAKGDLNAPAFSLLPKPRPGHHPGHGH